MDCFHMGQGEGGMNELIWSNLDPHLSFRHVKVYNTTNYKVVHNFDYASAILSLALAVRHTFYYSQPPYVYISPE